MIEDAKENPKKKMNKPFTLSGVAIIIVLTLLMAFLYLDRNNVVSKLIQSYGASGVIGAVLIMTVLCLTPLPSEGLLIMYLKIYGVQWGMLYSWFGFTLGTIVAFAIARFLRNHDIGSRIFGDSRFQAIDSWITRKGTGGLLLVRLLPIPAFIVNLFTGILPSVSFGKYLWTGAVGIVPYYLGVSLIYLGISRQEVLGFLIGIPVLILIWIIGFWDRRHKD